MPWEIFSHGTFLVFRGSEGNAIQQKGEKGARKGVSVIIIAKFGGIYSFFPESGKTEGGKFQIFPVISGRRNVRKLHRKSMFSCGKALVFSLFTKNILLIFH